MRGVLGHELKNGGNGLADEIRRETDGNPFFVGEIVRHLDEAGAGSLTDVGLPQSIREVVRSRAERLGEKTSSLLSTAAVIGRDFDLNLLARAVGRDEDELFGQLEGAATVALLQEGRVAGRFSFAHSLVNHTLYEGLGPTRQASEHQRVAEAIEDLVGAEPGERSVELAQHWLRSAVPDRAQKAAHYCVLAGEQALEALAPEEALGWFRRALDLLDELPEVDPSQRCDVLIGYGDAQRQVGDSSYSETLLEASDIAQELGDGGRMARAADANSRGFSSVVGQIEERRVAALEAALELCTEDQQRAQLLSLLAVELSYGARLDRRLELSAEAVRLARASGNRHSLAWALARRQIAIAAPQTLSERIVETEEVIALADEIDDTLLRYWASVFQGLLALDVGDFETAARGREVQEAIAAETGQPMFLWVNTFAPALLATMAGDFELAEDLTNRSAGLGTEAGQPDVFAVYAAQIHVIRYEQGRLEEILEVQEQAVEEAPLLEAYSGALALTYCELGETERAREALRASAERGFDVTPTPSSKAALGFLSEVAARTGETDAAGALYERLLPWRDQLSYTGVTMFGPVERYLGLTATCLGRHEDAAAHFRRSAATCERIEAPTWLARTRHEWALMLHARGGPGDRESAETLLSQALEAAERYGCRSLERRVRAAIEDPERARV